MDRLDYRIIDLLSREPGISVLSAARELEVARPTVQSRLNRLHASGVIVSIAPRLDPASMGYPVQAVTMLQLDQHLGHDTIHVELEAIPEVLDACTIVGEWDMLLRLAATSNEDLQHVLDRVTRIPAVQRSSTSVILRDYVRARTLPLLDRATADDTDG